MADVWAGTVAHSFGIRGPAGLLSLPSSHPIALNVSHSKLELIVRGGSDPARVTFDGQSVASIVAGIPEVKAAATDEIADHALFKYARERNAPGGAYALLNLESPIIQITVADWLHREWLGLAEDSDGETQRLTVDWTEYRSLDGLYVLVRALEAAKRSGEREQAFHLEQAWRSASTAFGARIGLERHKCDTWHWFIEHVLDGPWWPSELAQLELDSARQELIHERGKVWLKPKGKESVRRRNLDIEQRALVRRTRQRPFFMVRPTEPRWVWLVMHRDRIARHVDRATDVFLRGNSAPTLPPLQIPRSLADMRAGTGSSTSEPHDEMPDWATGNAVAYQRFPDARDEIFIAVVDD